MLFQFDTQILPKYHSLTCIAIKMQEFLMILGMSIEGLQKMVLRVCLDVKPR